MARAKYVVLLGPDGSGKTTVADRLAVALEADGHSVSRLNFSFGIMPAISRVLGKEERKAAPEGQRGSGMVKPLTWGRAAFLACWYGIDHLLGHWWMRRGPVGEVVIFARSYHDFLYQRAYLNLPEAIPRLFLALGPKPDLVATPLRDPQAINGQKPELTTAEITEQYTRIVGRFKRYQYFAGINASDGVIPVVARIRDRLGL